MHPDPVHNPLECSPFLGGLVRRHPAWLERLRDSGRLELDDPPNPANLQALIDTHGLDAGLRRHRNFEMLRITWRELARLATVEQTLADLSTLADLTLQAAIDAHDASLSARHGQPRNVAGQPQGLVVLGLGKLGGGELNLSSDIDVIFCFPEGGETDGPRSLANEQYFQRLARAVIRSLSEMTADGFCFRVDTRLRPFGEAGPLVCSFGAMEQYYQREGRDWERYALVKARAVAGDLAEGQSLINSLRPFVYRRYIDYGAVEALRSMQSSVHEDARRKGREQDVKRGRGGIRDIEFLVQCLQLLRGGREPTLQTPSLMKAISELERLDILAPALSENLREDYRFLRRLENAIQALHDRQEHSLPQGDDLQRVSMAMGFSERSELLSAFETCRERVTASIEDSFPPPPDDAVQRHWLQRLDDPDNPPGEALLRFRQRLDRMALSQRAESRLNQFMPMMLQRMDRDQTPEAVQADVLELVAGICRRSAYLSLLVENPQALDRTLELFTLSDWVARTVIRYPALLDELIDPALGQALPSREETEARLRRIVTPDADPETVLLSLNHLKRTVSLRIAVAELAGRIDAQGSQVLLSELAEALLGAALHLAEASMTDRHGTLPEAGLALVAYGSLGAFEMSYSSDLDLIFLYRSGPGSSNGAKPLAAEHYFTRLTRRLLALITTLTAAGRLYEVDTRLRPNGRSGLLVSTVEAFGRYQSTQAWTWELQALVRARPVGGDSEVAEAFSRIRREVLGQARDPQTLAADVLDMREKMRSSIKGGDPLKHSAGAMVDIDFVSQLGVLSQAAGHPGLLVHSSTQGFLPALAGVGWLSDAEANQLSGTHHELTRARHLSALSRRGPGTLPALEDSARICAARLGMEKHTTPG